MLHGRQNSVPINNVKSLCLQFRRFQVKWYMVMYIFRVSHLQGNSERILLLCQQKSISSLVNSRETEDKLAVAKK